MITLDMQPYQVRVLEERKELAARIERLMAFLAAPQVGPVTPEQRLLRVQLPVMQAYLAVLDERIELWD
jgi:hypothetical protein